MSSKQTAEELLAQFDNLDVSTEPSNDSSSAPKAAASSKPATQTTDAEDPLAELTALATQRSASRPNTPKVPSSTTTSSSKKTGIATPSSTGSARNSDEVTRGAPRKSAEFATNLRQSFTPANDPPVEESRNDAQEQKPAGGGWGGWFTNISATADAVRKQAEAAYKEIQKNEEAQRWAEQVRGNVANLRGLGKDISSQALPTFTNILHTLAPPIAQHERLMIHITHDLHGYPSLDPLIYNTFSRVMSQVEGGDLMVIQRGSESKHRRASDAGYRGSSNASGWSDGPWWRDSTTKRELGSVKGLTEGTKLVRVGAESYSKDYFDSQGGVEAAAQKATETLSEDNPVRSSDIFLALQPITHVLPADMFGGTGEGENKEGGVEEQKGEDELVCFAVYLHDPIHSISFHSISQSFPQRWADWLDAANSVDGEDGRQSLPEEIVEIVTTGGVDPREWVAEWMEEVISLTVGVVAQRYVARRMGVGEGGIGRGKRRQEAIESGGGEVARAGII